MSPQTFRTIKCDDQTAPSVTRSRAGARTVLWHEMTVIASSVADVVASAGGWLFDRRMAGWKVNVLVADRAGEQALQILGADVLDLSGHFDAISEDPDRAARSRSLPTCMPPTNAFGDSSQRRTAAAPKWRFGVKPAHWTGMSAPWSTDSVRRPGAFKAQALLAAGMPSESGGSDGSPVPLRCNRSRAGSL